MDADVQEAIGTGKKIIYWVIGLFLVVGLILWIAGAFTSTAKYAFIQYEQFQEIYNTCEKVNQDLCLMRDLPETDKMFEQFSKAQRINTLQVKMNLWVNEYNAKSKLWHQSMWKSKELPYQLSVNNFSYYNGVLK